MFIRFSSFLGLLLTFLLAGPVAAQEAGASPGAANEVEADSKGSYEVTLRETEERVSVASRMVRPSDGWLGSRPSLRTSNW